MPLGDLELLLLVGRRLAELDAQCASYYTNACLMFSLNSEFVMSSFFENGS